ncbi:MAG: fumarylacetoacetate hydrolase family protein [Polaromonas sp.]|nr:fumarylacetoacetate hydrolase family protein [Polaromonas sp.]
MQLVSFVHPNANAQVDIRLGAFLGTDSVLDLQAAAQALGSPDPRLSSMLSLIRGGDAALALARHLVQASPREAVLRRDAVGLRAPLPVPESIRDFANHELHVRQAIHSAMTLRAAATTDPKATFEGYARAGLLDIPPVWYELPLYYKGNRFSCIGHEQTVQWPDFAQRMDYELELAVVIGKTVCNATPEQAMDAVFGYTIFNDFSARDMQSRETSFRLGPAKGKDFDTGNAFGPCIVTRDQVDDPDALGMRVRVNGEERVSTVAGGMQHGIAACISHVSRSETLYPGEILGMGTLGNGCGYESLRFLEAGDVVELEVERIGILRNTLGPRR